MRRMERKELTICGIAGFNVSQEVSKNLSEDSIKEIIAHAWEYNVHRGSDAAGFFATYLEPYNDTQLLYFKKDKSALDLLGTLAMLEPGHPSVVGAHTRLATLGKKEDNINNHPVGWNGCWTTHNGHISNHEVLRRLAREGGSVVEQEPVVDTAGISAILSLITKPKDQIDKIKEYLQKIEGGFAIHVVWNAHPGLSLLARGTSSPLVLRIADGIVTYSSEPEASYMMMQAMGLDPESEDVTLRALDPGHFILVENGNPIYWDRFTPAPTRWGNNVPEKKGPHKITRLLPDSDKPLYINDKADLFGNNLRPWSSMATTDVHLIYSRAEGIRNNGYEDAQMIKHVFGHPMGSGTRPGYLQLDGAPIGMAFGEIDALSYHIPKGKEADTTLYVWIGNTELVLTKYGSIREIYNWNDVFDRWMLAPIEVAPVLPTEPMTFNDWLIKNSAFVKTELETDKKPLAPWMHKFFTNSPPAPTENRHLPVRQMDFYSEYDDGWEDAEISTYLREKEQQALNLGLSEYDNVPDSYYEVVEKGFKDFITIDMVESIDYCFIDTQDGVLPFMNGKEWCDEHRSPLEMHDDPFACEFVIKAAGSALMAADSVSVLEGMFNSEIMNHVEVKTRIQRQRGSKLCDEHNWRSSSLRTVKYKDLEFWWPLEDHCIECKADKKITQVSRLMSILQGGQT